MSAPIVIALCARTANAVRDWADAGYECWCVDLQHSVRRERVEGNIHFVYGDARSWKPPVGRRIAFACAMPDCTHVAGSGARDFKVKGPRLLTDAIDLFNACDHALAWSGAPYWVENSVGVLSTHVREPDHIFDPWEYAGYLEDVQTDNTCKATCLWTGNGFIMPTPRPAPGLHRSDCWLASPSDDRGDIRAITPAGFARAVFEANDPLAAQAALSSAS